MTQAQLMSIVVRHSIRSSGHALLVVKGDVSNASDWMLPQVWRVLVPPHGLHGVRDGGVNDGIVRWITRVLKRFGCLEFSYQCLKLVLLMFPDSFNTSTRDDYDHLMTYR
nr:hypothetical protein CFP56_19315 [Quercus suber]